jgi:hypothetical protein
MPKFDDCDEFSPTQKSSEIDYRYGEDITLKELKEYIDATYSQHYSRSKFQATEFIIDNGHGEGFCLGNVMKYAQRYGKKNGRDKKDLLKIIHYAIMMMHVHRIEEDRAAMSILPEGANTITITSDSGNTVEIPSLGPHGY